MTGNPLKWTDPLGFAPGDPYPSADDTAKSALGDVIDQSNEENAEYGGWITENDF